jgi:tetratricopeptide (TPR) repeat protein
LRVDAEQWDRAYDLMNLIDERYLTGWGQSDALIRWRERVAGHLSNPHREAVNTSFLVAARAQQHEDPAADLTLLQGIPQRVREVAQGRVGLWLQEAVLRAGNGRSSTSVTEFRAIAEECRAIGMPVAEAVALGCAAHHLGVIGRFTAALEHQRAAAALLAGEADDRHRDRVRAWLPLSLGWLHHRIGRWEEALEILEEGSTAAERLRDDQLYARYLDGRATVLCERGDAPTAADLARSAADRAALTRKPAIIREATRTLAMAYLVENRIAEARVAAEAALRQPASRRQLGTLALRGVIAFREGDRPTARRAFAEACVEAATRRALEPNDFVALDQHGIALFGLALCTDHPDRLGEAVAAFRRSRRVTDAKGVRHQRLHLLDLFGQEASGRARAEVREVIMG